MSPSMRDGPHQKKGDGSKCEEQALDQQVRYGMPRHGVSESSKVVPDCDRRVVMCARPACGRRYAWNQAHAEGMTRSIAGVFQFESRFLSPLRSLSKPARPSFSQFTWGTSRPVARLAREGRCSGNPRPQDLRTTILKLAYGFDDATGPMFMRRMPNSWGTQAVA